MSELRYEADQTIEVGQGSFSDWLNDIVENDENEPQLTPEERLERRIASCGKVVFTKRNPTTGMLSLKYGVCRVHRRCNRCLYARKCRHQIGLKDARNSGNNVMAVSFEGDKSKEEKNFLRRLKKLNREYRRYPMLVDNDGYSTISTIVLYPGDGSEHGESYEFNHLLDSDAIMTKLVNTPEGCAISGDFGKPIVETPVQSVLEQDIEIVGVQSHRAEADCETIREVNEQALQEARNERFETLQDALDWLNERFEYLCRDRGVALYRNRIEFCGVNRNEVVWCHIVAKQDFSYSKKDESYVVCPNCDHKIPIDSV
jgi:hypothetical protein